MSVQSLAMRLVIGGDASGAKSALKALGGETEKTGKKLKKTQTDFAKGLKAAQGAAAVGLVAIAGVVTKGISSYEGLTAAVAALQRQSKVSATDASLLVGQWQRYGVDAAAGGKGVMMLSKQIDAANIGTQTSIDTFARLGITLDDLKTMSPYQVLEQVRSTLSEMPPSAERTAISAKLLGKGFMSMSKWIAASSTDLDALNQQLKDSGQVMDEAELAKAKDDMKQMALLQVDLRGLFVEVGRSAMPIIRDLVPGLKKLLAVAKPLAPHLIEIGGALATFLVVSKVATGFGTFVTVLGKLKTLLVGGKIASGIAGLAGGGGIGTFVKDSRGKTVAQSLLGGGGSLAKNGPLEAAIAANTAATEANTLALGGKGIPGGGVGGAAPGGGAASGAGMGFIRTVAAIAVPIAVGITAGEIVYAHRPERTPLGEASASGMVNPRSGTIMTPERIALFRKNGEQAGDALAAGVNAGGADIARSLRASGDKAGAGLAAGLARGVGPALQSIQKVRSSAGRPIHMGNLDATQMINEIARLASAFGSVRSAARTAGDAAANAIRSPSGGGGSYRGHFMARGGDFMVRRPTLFVAGEAGLERATFTPQGQKAPGGGSGETHFHFHVGQIVGTDERAARQFWNLVKPIAMSDMRMKMAMSRG